MGIWLGFVRILQDAVGRMDIELCVRTSKKSVKRE